VASVRAKAASANPRTQSTMIEIGDGSFKKTIALWFEMAFVG
jgi:hypothetical protein